MRSSIIWMIALLILPLGAHADLTERQVKLLHNNCLQCHVRSDIGAPLMGKQEDWQARIKTGEDAMLRNVIQGIRGMPPYGYCSACDEADLRVLIRALSGTMGEQQ